MSNPQAVLTDADNVVRVSRDLAYEIAAVSAAILDAREEKTRVAKKFNTDIKALEKRQRTLIDEIRSGGDTQLAIKFGSSVNTERALASTAPSDGDDDRDEDVEDLSSRVDDLEEAQRADEEEALEALGATH